MIKPRRHNRRGEPTSLLDVQRPFEASARTVIEADVHLHSPGRGWAIVEHYQGDEFVYVTIAGDRLGDPSTGTVYGVDSISCQLPTLEEAESFGLALAAAARRALELRVMSMMPQSKTRTQPAGTR